MNHPTASHTGPAQALGPELTIAFAAAVHEQLAQVLMDTSGDLHLDLAGVTDFDSAGVQLLLATRRSLQDRGDALMLQTVSPAVRDGLATFGLHDLLPGSGQPHA